MPLDTPSRTATRLSKVSPSRRTLVRGAAWSVPVVSVAAAAPAFAVLSNTTTTPQLTGGYWVMDWSGGRYGLVPTITVSNPSAKLTGQLTITLTFAYPDFMGDTSGHPAQPGFSNAFASTQTWVLNTPRPSSTGVVVQLICSAGLGAHQSDTITGQIANWRFNPATIDWANSPTAAVQMTVQASGPGFDTGVGVMAAGPKPA
jgi:hypothetical protein